MMSASSTMLQPATAPDDRATEYKAADTAAEHYNGFTLMVEAYAAIWLVMMIWFFFIWRKQADLTARINGLEDALTRAEQSKSKSKAESPA
jgi:hypothetical protein